MRKNLLTMDVILAKEIKYILEKEGFLPGDKLPSERFLAEKFNVQRTTIRSALALLIREKYIVAEERKGYFVAPKRILISIRRFEQSYIPARQHRNIDCRLYDFERTRADKRLSGKMMLPEDTPVFRVTKIDSENGIPLSIDFSYLPVDIYPEFTQELAGQKEILELLTENLQTEIVKANQKVTLIYTNETESRLLDVPPGSPMIKYKGLVYDSQGRLVLFFERIMKMDDFAFVREAEREDTWNQRA